MVRPYNSCCSFTFVTTGIICIILIFLHGLNRHGRLFAPVQHAIGKIHSFHTATEHPSWLIATVVRASDFQRREIIRSTWQHLYANDTRQTTRFVTANPGPLWHDLVQMENATYGDIVTLEHLEETTEVANTIKSIEMLKHFARSGEKWNFVSKVDDDSFVEANAFYETYLAPLLLQAGGSIRKAIARTVGPNANYDFTYPGGQFYTLSWDLVTLLADLHDVNPLPYGHEDALVGGLLREAGIEYTHIDLPNEVAFDYDASQARAASSAWAKPGDELTEWVHAVGPGAINPHKMKSDEDYLKVAACFDGVGLRIHEFELSAAAEPPH